MAVKVMIPVALRQFAGGSDTVEFSGQTVGEVLKQLGEQFPDLRKHLFGDDGELRNFVNVFLNDENIRDRDGQATVLSDSDELVIVPAVAGGS